MDKRCVEMRQEAALPVILLVLVAILLYFGLRPQGEAEGKRAALLTESATIRLGGPSMAYVDGVHFPGGAWHNDAFTLHMAVTLENVELLGFRPLLTFHDGSDEKQLAIWHWGGSLIAMNGDDYDFSRRLPRISTENVLQAGKPVLLTVTSGAEGTDLYVDGEPAGHPKDCGLMIPVDGDQTRLILGNSVYGKHGWQGDFHALLLVGAFSDAEDVQILYRNWLDTGSLVARDGVPRLLAYDFALEENHTITDLSGNGNNLLLPARPKSLKHTFFGTFIHDIHSRGFQLDAFLNLSGFIPLGLLLSFWLRRTWPFRPGVACLVVTACGFILSFSIELVQAWIPGRASSVLDLSLNSAGTLIGCIIALLACRVGLVRQLF